jgi:hypothetical protein
MADENGDKSHDSLGKDCGATSMDGCDDRADLADLLATPPIFGLQKFLVFGLRLTSGGPDRFIVLSFEGWHSLTRAERLLL